MAAATAATAAATGAATAAGATGAATEAATEADLLGTTLLMTHIPFGKNSNTTIPIPNTPALHNNTTPYSRCIR